MNLKRLTFSARTSCNDLLFPPQRLVGAGEGVPDSPSRKGRCQS